MNGVVRGDFLIWFAGALNVDECLIVALTVWESAVKNLGF